MSISELPMPVDDPTLQDSSSLPEGLVGFCLVDPALGDGNRAFPIHKRDLSSEQVTQFGNAMCRLGHWSEKGKARILNAPPVTASGKYYAAIPVTKTAVLMVLEGCLEALKTIGVDDGINIAEAVSLIYAIPTLKTV